MASLSIYIVLIVDRHSDIGVEIFTIHKKAREYAIEWCEKYSLDGEYEYTDYKTFESYHYSPEDDRVMIFKKEVTIL